MSGRLDNETLNELRAFPGQRNGPPEQFPRPWPPGERFYRRIPGPVLSFGFWVLSFA